MTPIIPVHINRVFLKPFADRQRLTPIFSFRKRWLEPQKVLISVEPQIWPLIGPDGSRDLDTGLWLAPFSLIYQLRPHLGRDARYQQRLCAFKQTIEGQWVIVETEENILGTRLWTDWEFLLVITKSVSRVQCPELELGWVRPRAERQKLREE